MARNFDGSDDKGLNQSVEDLDVPITLAAWVQLDVTGALRTIISVGDTVNPTNDQRSNFRLESTNSSPPAFNARVTLSGGSSVAATSGTFSADTWVHAAAVFASATSRFAYVNGTPGTENTSNMNKNWTTNGIVIGSNWSDADATPTGRFDGFICEVGIWTAALSSEEIKSLANGANPRRIRPGNLVFYAPYYGAYNPEPDWSGRGYNSTLTGTTYNSHCPFVQMPFGFDLGWEGNFVTSLPAAVVHRLLMMRFGI